MRLILDNFRCFKHIEIDFPENGTILLWGTSGIGKTSIFKAINFVLYGKENRHIIRHGEKKCKVELEYLDKKTNKQYNIIRTKNPSHLKIAATLKEESPSLCSDGHSPSAFVPEMVPVPGKEDDEAQELIYSLFGKEFMLTSYMAQKSTESFFYLPNNEKSSFLQKLSVKDFDVESLRKKTREIIRKRKDKIIALTSEIKTLDEQLSLFSGTGYEEPVLKLDLKGKNINDFIIYEEKLREKNKTTIKSLKEEIQQLIKEKNKAEELYKKINEMLVTLNEKKSIIKDLETQKDDLSFPEPELPSSTSYESKIKDLNLERKKIQDRIELIEIQNNYKKIKLEYEDIFNCEKFELENEIEKLNKSLNDVQTTQLDESEYKQLSILVENYKNCISIFQEYFEEEEYNVETNIINVFSDLINTLKDTLSETNEKLLKKTEALDIVENKLFGLETEEENLKNIIIQNNNKIRGLDPRFPDSGSGTVKNSLKCPKCSIHFYVDKNEKVIEIKQSLEGIKEQQQELTIKLNEISKEIHPTKILKQKLIKEIDSLKIEINTLKSDIKKFPISVPEMVPDNKSIVDKVDNYLQLKSQIDSITSNIKNNALKLNILLKGPSDPLFPKHIKQKYKDLINLETRLSTEDLGSSTVEEGAGTGTGFRDPALISGTIDSLTKQMLEIDNTIIMLKEQLFKIESISKSILKITNECNHIEEQLLIFTDTGPKARIEETGTGFRIKDALSSGDASLRSTLLRLPGPGPGLPELETKLQEKEKQYEIFQRRKEKVDKYIQQKEKWDIYIQIKTKIDGLKDEEKFQIRGLSKAETMLKLINDSESLSLLNIIDNINGELEEYILSFFGEGVNVKLEAYKEDKSGEKKNCIDIVIVKDGEKVSLDSLSGGEFDRVALGFFLAFNKVAKSDIIMLDECLASLHSELVEDIVEMIKTKLSNKLVLFTLHQANIGMFDNVINIEEYRCCND